LVGLFGCTIANDSGVCDCGCTPGPFDKQTYSCNPKISSLGRIVPCPSLGALETVFVCFYTERPPVSAQAETRSRLLDDESCRKQSFGLGIVVYSDWDGITVIG